MRSSEFDGGRLVVNLADMPIKCPVAPIEFAFLADWYLRERGIRARASSCYATPLDGSFTKPIASEHLTDLLGEKEIELVTEFSAGEIDGVGGKLTSYDGRELDFDLLVTVPLHGGAAYVERSPGLGDALGFVPTDKRTLQTTGEAERVRARRRHRPAHLEGRLRHPLRGGGAHREHRPLLRRSGARRRLRRTRELLHRDRLPQGAADRLQLRDGAAARPFPSVFGLPLLRESRLNHLGKLAFQWAYWHALLPGRDIPGIGPTMPTAGKKRTPIHA